MSQPQTFPTSESLSLQNPQAKSSTQKQNIDGIHSQDQNQQNNGQKRQEDNDYQCEFKLIVKEKFQQKLKHDQTQDVFTVVINEIIEERIRRNYVVQEQSTQKAPEITTNVQQTFQDVEETKNGPSQLDRLKAEDEQVKKKIKQLLRKRPNKKSLTYELDPNRDKGFILAKRMNEIKQQRQKKHIQTKKQLETQKSQMIQSQMSTIACIQNFSMHLARKGNRRYTKESEDYKLPKLTHTNNFLDDTQKFSRSKNGFYDFLSKSRSNIIDQTPERMSTLYSKKYESSALSARSIFDTKKEKKRDLQREIEILRKSQKITQKYQIRKIASDFLIDIIFSAVKVVEAKKEFFFNAPPKPVHEMIRNYKDKNGKTVWIPGSKPDKFRINIHLKQKKGNQSRVQTMENIDQRKDTEKNDSRISQISRTIDICLKNKSDQQDSEKEEDKKEQNQQKAQNEQNEIETNSQQQNEKQDDQQDQQQKNNSQNNENQQETQKEEDSNEFQHLVLQQITQNNEEIIQTS